MVVIIAVFRIEYLKVFIFFIDEFFYILRVGFVLWAGNRVYIF